MTPFDKATQVLAVIPPTEVWNVVARSDKQFVCAGETHHGHLHIKREVAAALPVLREWQFGHLATEHDWRDHQRAFDAFHRASPRQQKSGGDQRRLRRHLSSWVNPYVTDCTDSLHEDMDAEFNLIAAARRCKMPVRCLNEQMGFDEFLEARGEPEAKKYVALLEYAIAHDDMPKGTTAAEHKKLIALDDSYIEYTKSLDKERAQRLIEACGDDRALVYYGSDHFRTSKAAGIDKFLPSGSTTSIMLGEHDLVWDTMRYNFRRHRGSLPDFVITTDSAEGFVLPPARKNGLWP